jgi:hypothetical protein
LQHLLLTLISFSLPHRPFLIFVHPWDLYFALSYLQPKQQALYWSITCTPDQAIERRATVARRCPRQKVRHLRALPSTKRVLREKVAAHCEECFDFCSGCVLHHDPDIGIGSEVDPSRPLPRNPGNSKDAHFSAGHLFSVLGST